MHDRCGLSRFDLGTLFDSQKGNPYFAGKEKGIQMLSNFISAALRHAKYEMLESGMIYAEVPELQGVWSEGSTVEECRSELAEVIEGWLFLKLRDGDAIPVIDQVDLNTKLHADAS